MVRALARTLDPIHELHVLLNQSGLMRYAEIAHSFDADDRAGFLDLVQELRATESSAYTESETPIFTCLSVSLERALDALDGERVVASA